MASIDSKASKFNVLKFNVKDCQICMIVKYVKDLSMNLSINNSNWIEENCKFTCCQEMQMGDKQKVCVSSALLSSKASNCLVTFGNF